MKISLKSYLSIVAIAVGVYTTFTLFNPTISNAMTDQSGNTIPQGQVPEMNQKTSLEYQKPSDVDLQKRLTPLQYKVTQGNGTERPFNNEYWDNKKQGIYVDIVSGEPLFSSVDKYESKTGWPSFTKPIEDSVLSEKEDRTLFSVRVEIRSKLADSHLGHVFDDGPAPTGKRYCINSASLRFIPQDKLLEENYGQYTKLFK